MIPGTYRNGFAPRDQAPLYPGLWRGCVGAWCPSLGPTGATLRDWSRRNNGTLTNLTLDTAWQTSEGRWASRHSGGSSSRTIIENATFFDSVLTNNFSISMWFNSQSSSSLRVLLGTNNTGGAGDNGFAFYLNNRGPAQIEVQMYQDAGTSVTAFSAHPSGWNHVAAVVSGGLSVRLNGGSELSAAGTGTQSTPNSRALTIGGFPTLDGFAMDAFWDDLRIYNRVLNASEIGLLYSGGRGRGIAYAMRSHLTGRYKDETIDLPGIEWTADAKRTHWWVSNKRSHWTAPHSRAHWIVPEE